eukprot:3666556-Pyramimonas_sp.AAC.1
MSFPRRFSTFLGSGFCTVSGSSFPVGGRPAWILRLGHARAQPWRLVHRPLVSDQRVQPSFTRAPPGPRWGSR